MSSTNGHHVAVGDLVYRDGREVPINENDVFHAQLPEQLPPNQDGQPSEHLLRALGRKAIVRARKHGLVIHAENEPDPQHPEIEVQMDPPVFVGSGELPEGGLPIKVQLVGNPKLAGPEEPEPQQDVWVDGVRYVPR